MLLVSLPFLNHSSLQGKVLRNGLTNGKWMTSRGENRYTNLNSKVWRRRFSELYIYLSQYNQPSILPDMHSENTEVTIYQNTIYIKWAYLLVNQKHCNLLWLELVNARYPSVWNTHSWTLLLKPTELVFVLVLGKTSKAVKHHRGVTERALTSDYRPLHKDFLQNDKNLNQT